MKRFQYLLWVALVAASMLSPVPATAQAKSKAAKAFTAKAKAVKAEAAKIKALAAASRADCARQAAIAADAQAAAARRNAGAQPPPRSAPVRRPPASAQVNADASTNAGGAARPSGGSKGGGSEPLPVLRPDSATSYLPGATLRIELGANSYGPLTYGNKNLILPFTLDFVQRFTTDNGQQPTSGLRLRAVLDPTRHRMNDSVYAAYTLLQTGRLEADADLFVESSPVADFSLNAHGGAGLRFYPLFTQQREWRFYETYEQVLLRLGGGFAYRLRTHDGRHRAWGQLAGNFDYVRHWHDFASRGETYYRQHVGPQLFFTSLQAQLRFTIYVRPRVGLELNTNWYGRPADGPQTKYFDARLGVVYHFGARSFGPVVDPLLKRQRRMKNAADKAATRMDNAARRSEQAAKQSQQSQNKAEAAATRSATEANRAATEANRATESATKAAQQSANSPSFPPPPK